jgi:hypothetical protein
MSKMFQVYGIGQALIPVLPPPLPFGSAPTSNQSNYEIGQVAYTPAKSPTAFYMYAGAGDWLQFLSSSGNVISVTGTTNQILASPTSGNVVLSLIGPYTPATYTAHGVLIGEGTSSIVATAAGSAGQLLTSGGASADPGWTTATYPSTVGAGALLLGTASNVVGSLADVAVGQLLASGGVGVVPAYTASPSVSGNMTAATGFVATTAGAGITLNSAATSGTTTATLNGRSGQVTITTPTINAGATFTMTISNTSITASSTQVLYGLTGGTTGSAITIQSVTNSAGQSAVVVQNASAVTNSTGSLVLTFLVLN